MPLRHALGSALALLTLGGAARAAIPLARRMVDTRLARDLVKAKGAPDLASLERGGEEVALGLFVEKGARLIHPSRWGKDRYELVRGRSPEGDESLIAFDHRSRRWWRLDATRWKHGDLTARRSADGKVLITRGFLGPDRPTFSAFWLSDKGVERLARFKIPWGELDRDLLRRIREGGLPVTSPDTQQVAFDRLDDLVVTEDGPRVMLRGTAYLGRLDAYRNALKQADPTLDLTARDIMLTRDWLPPGTMPVALRLEKGRVWVAGVGHLAEKEWSDPDPGPGVWVLPRPRDS